jgi:hypothetical protein
LSPGAAADRTRDGISERAKIDILGRAGSDIAADRATDDLDDQVDPDMTCYSPARCSTTGICARRRTIAGRSSLGARRSKVMLRARRIQTKSAINHCRAGHGP